MDSPSLPRDQHLEALSSLEAINRVSRTAQSLLPYVVSLARELGRDELDLLDVACGGGDVPLSLARLAGRRGIKLRLTLVDRSPTALAHAGKQDSEVRLLCVDALSEELPPADIVTNSLFLHHLDRPEATEVIRHLASAARHMLLISDLRRSRIGYALAWATCGISRSRVVQHDGPVSVQAAWTMSELAAMAHDAGLAGALIARQWPWRMLLYWRGR